MTEEIKTEPAVSDDIDLLLLIERAVLFFKKYKWVFIAAIVAGIASGTYFYRLQPKIYTSRLIAHSFFLTNQEHIQIIDAWNELLGKREYSSLTALFNCSENILRPLRSIKGDEIQKVFSPNNPNGFIIEVNVTDISILDSLEPAIVNGLENNGYVKQRIAYRRANLVQQIERTTTEIKRLDSTRNIIEGPVRKNELHNDNAVSDLASIYGQLTEMNEKLATYREQLQFSNAVQILQGFNKIKQPNGPRLFVWLFLGLVFFLSIAWVYALLRSINQKLKKRSGKKRSNT